MASDEYTLHFDERTGKWVKIPYDSSQSSDVGTSGWWSTTAEKAGLPRPKTEDNTAMMVALVGAVVFIALLTDRR